MSRCPRCALPDVFPGYDMTPAGMCNYCVYHDVFVDRLAAFRAGLRDAFTAAVADARRANPAGHHCILCYSGGKDSTFLLHLLKTQYGLNPLAFTLDNGFISPQAFRNIAKVVDALGVDHISFRPRSDVMKAVFREALTNDGLLSKSLLPYASQCCLSCISIVLSTALKMGREKGIPLVVIGFTPGQAADVSIESFMKTGSTVFFANEINRDDPVDFAKIVRDPLHEAVGESIDQYLIRSQYLDAGEQYPKVLYPYHAMVEYDEALIYDTIAKYGWNAPRDTDACSTNCRLNTVAIQAQVHQRGYHPYIAEMSCLVREGKLSWQEAVDREQTLANPAVVADVLSQLQLSPADIGIAPAPIVAAKRP
ncbi:MAG: hypothetical protein ACR2IT_10040 [Pirellulales bacterium]